MANLTGEQRAQVIDVLLQAFPNPMEMLMLLDRLDKNLRAIASTDSYRSDLFLVIKAAEAEGWLEDLIAAATRQNPGNRKLAQLVEDFQAWMAEPAPGAAPAAHLPYTYPWEGLLEGYRERSPALQRNLRDFLLYYLGTPQEPAPFGGRDRDLERLQSWLDDPDSSPYAALVARAGMGKSTLLAQWVSGLPAARPDDLWIAYYPISIRYSTNTEPDIYGGLAARVARLHGEPPPGVNEANLHVLYRDFLERPVPEGVTLLVILDGLDEKAGQPFGETLAPRHPPPHLRFLVAARPLALDRSAGAWPRRLGWRGRKAQLFELERLDPGGLAEVLHAMGDPLEHLAGDPDLVERLYALSEGDPLLVRLYVEALIGQEDQAAWLQPADLKSLESGLEAYFEQWFADQARLWGSDAPFHEPQVKGLVDLCATALGPLRQDDLVELGQGLLASGDEIGRAAGIFSRFLIGDGIERGYAFNHPRLGEYFARRHTRKERDELRGRFLAYGERVVQDLNQGAMLPEDAPEYVLRYYSAHLEQGRGRTAPETYSALLSDGWRRAWEALEGTPDGFLADAQRAWGAARAAGSTALGQVVRAALCFASVASLSSNLPPELLKRAVETGVLSLAQAEVYARRKTDARERILALSLLASQDGLPPDRRVDLVGQALNATLVLNSVYGQEASLQQLAEVIPVELYPRTLETISQVPDPQVQFEFLLLLARRFAPQYLPEVLEIVGRLGDPSNQAKIIISLVPDPPPDVRPDITPEQVSQVVRAAVQIKETYAQVEALASLAGLLDAGQRSELFQGVLASFSEMQSDSERAAVIQLLSPHLPDDLHGPALELVSQFEDPYDRARGLVALIAALPSEQQQPPIHMVEALLDEIADPFEKAMVIAGLVPNLEEERQAGLLEVAGELFPDLSPYYELETVLHKLAGRVPAGVFSRITHQFHPNRDINEMIQVLISLAPHLSAAELEQALELGWQVEDHFAQTRFIGEIAGYLPPALLDKTLDLIFAIDDAYNQAAMLGELAPYLPPDLYRRALEFANQMEDAYYRGKALAYLAGNLSQPEIKLTLDSIRGSYLKSISSESLVKLLPYLPPELLSEALDFSRKIGDANFVGQAFARLAAQLPPPQQEQVLKILQGWENAQAQAGAVTNLAPGFPPILLPRAIELTRRLGNQQAEYLADLAYTLAPTRISEALELIDQIGDPAIQAQSISQLAEHLPPPALEAWLPRILAFENPNVRVGTLVSLVPYLPEHLLSGLKEVPPTLEQNYHQARLLTSLASRMPPDEAQALALEARLAAAQIPDPYEQAKVLLELAPRLPENLQRKTLAQCLELSQHVSNLSNKGAVLARAAPVLPQDLLEAATAITLAVKDVYYLANILSELIPRLDEALLQQVLEFTGQMGDSYYQSKILVSLAPHLSPALLSQAIQIIRNDPENIYAGDNLAAQVPYLAPEQLEAVAKLAERLDDYRQEQLIAGMAAQLNPDQISGIFATLPNYDEYFKASVLTSLAPYLPPELHPLALATSETIEDPGSRVQVLAALLPTLPPTQAAAVRSKAIGIAQEIKDSLERASAQNSLIPFLTPAELAGTLADINPILERTSLERDALLEYYTRPWPEICQAAGKTEHAALSDLLERLTPSGRELVLEVLTAFAPVITRLGGEQAVLDCLVAMRDVTSWWP